MPGSPVEDLVQRRAGNLAELRVSASGERSLRRLARKIAAFR
ncbi:hypothetical protein F9C11_16165 [Amycolatopsis sp. VS8301801F10]